MSKHPPRGQIADINTKLIGAMIAGGLAWVFWTIGVGEWVMFRLFAAIFAVTAVVSGVQGLWLLIRTLFNLTRFARFKRQGAAPKAELLADSKSLKRRGLVK